MIRLTYKNCTAAIGIGLALSHSILAAELHREGKQPNILFIMTDQQHANMMSCTGNKYLKTAALDSLARDGIRFARAYSANPVCVPSRTSMATGVMPCRLGAGDNNIGMMIKLLPPEVDANSMGKIMKRAGYNTFYGGKVHMCSSLVPKNAGYDEYFKDERELLAPACLTFIKKKRNIPFFAVASFINPHDICYADAAQRGENNFNMLKLYKQASSLPLEQLPPLPDNYAIQLNEPSAIEAHLAGPKAITPTLPMRKEYDEREWRIYRWIYNRLTEKVDEQIGEILDGLKVAGLEDNTVVIFTSDHGNMDASHQLASKGLFYEESVGVPLIIKYKGNIPAGRTDQTHLISTGLDILPTICDYAGVEKPGHLLGQSLRPLAEGKSVDHWRKYVASENKYTRMIRTPRYKYCVFDDPNSKESLVDLGNDPGETRNLIDNPEYRQILNEHRALLADWSTYSSDHEAPKYVRTSTAGTPSLITTH